MSASFSRILDPDRLFQVVFRHSILKKFSLQSKVLGVRKSFYVYFPAGYEDLDVHLPVLYLFRNHEDEWVNRHQDDSRKGKNVRDVLDELIRSGTMKPMLVVMPGLGSDDNHIPGLGVNFFYPQKVKSKKGIGTGLFEDYLVKELIPYIDTRFRTVNSRYGRAVDGFSIGGYTAVMLAIKHPELFYSAGSFDGTHMWLNFSDPRNSGSRDKTWLENGMFEPAFGKPFSIPFALVYNTSNMLHQLSRKKQKPDYRFQITCVNREPDGNRDRALHLLYQLQKCGYTNELPTHVLHPEATHTWYWADEHIRLTAPRHSQFMWEKIILENQ